MAKIKINENIVLPEGVQGTVTKNKVTIKGPKGELSREFRDSQVLLSGSGSSISVVCENATKREKARALTYCAHLRNMAKGVTDGHRYELKICASHFPMNVSINNKQFIVKNFLGEKIPRKLTIKEGANVKIDGTLVSVESVSKEIAGQVAGDIEQLCRITNRDRRVFQDGIYITIKDGKEVI